VKKILVVIALVFGFVFTSVSAETASEVVPVVQEAPEAEAASNCYFTALGTTHVTSYCSRIEWPYVAQVTWIRCWRRTASGTNVYDTNYSPKTGTGYRSVNCDPYYVRSGQGINLVTTW
jgi:hypothetical protein